MSSVRAHAENARLHGAAAAYDNARRDDLSPRQSAWLLAHLRRIEPDWKPPIRERHRLVGLMLASGVPDVEIREALQISQPTLWRHKQKASTATTPEPGLGAEVGSRSRSTTDGNHSKPANPPDRSTVPNSGGKEWQGRPVTGATPPLLTSPPDRVRPKGMPVHLGGLCPREHWVYATERADGINGSGVGTSRREFERKPRGESP